MSKSRQFSTSLVLAKLEDKGTWHKSCPRFNAWEYRELSPQNAPDFIYPFLDATEIGPRMLARILRLAGLSRRDVRFPT
jgi:hypothetical protein